MRRKVILRILAVCILSFGTIASLAVSEVPILLSIDDSNPSAVTITATSSNSYADYNGNPASAGVDLLGFFSVDEQNLSHGQFSGGTLQGGNDGVPYDSLLSDNYSTSGGVYYDLEVYLSSSSVGSGNTETFSTSQQAFTGTWTVNLTSLGVNASDLPAADSEGSIISGNSANAGSFIGEWQVLPVPEPRTEGLLALGTLVAGTMVFRRRLSH